MKVKTYNERIEMRKLFLVRMIEDYERDDVLMSCIDKQVEITSEELELLKTFCETELQMVGNEEEVYMIKALLKKLEALKS